MEMAQAVVTAVGPVGVCVLAAVWLLTRRRENGAQTPRRNQVLETLAKIDADVGHLRDVTGKSKRTFGSCASLTPSTYKDIRSSVTIYVPVYVLVRKLGII